MKTILWIVAFAATATICKAQIVTDGPIADEKNGRILYLKNCAHCHGADGHGDDGPDLHDLDWTDEQIATRIRNGKKGQMTAFAGTLSSKEITELTVYLRTLK